MEATQPYENFPLTTVIQSNFVSLANDALGFLIILKLGLTFALLFLLYLLVLEYRLLRGCTNCFYWGRICGFGKGRISALFFKKGDPAKFCERQITWRYLIPDLLVSLIPLAAGFILLILEFNVLLLSAMILIVLFTTAGNNYIRGKLTCSFCRQRELGCPAYALFNKGK